LRAVRAGRQEQDGCGPREAEVAWRIEGGVRGAQQSVAVAGRQGGKSCRLPLPAQLSFGFG